MIVMIMIVMLIKAITMIDIDSNDHNIIYSIIVIGKQHAGVDYFLYS